ncbi:MAG: DNA topoisomerase VI subunit B [Candidatus Marsarchaeota archaeon]|nr:DNA topoisomerase VI subunit B [Candidatus Marsarchaeota archaeon]
MAMGKDIFNEFKEHSISEFFKKNRQMLGYSSTVRSLVTVVHEYVSNSIDATEEAGILPDITIKLEKISENRYTVEVSDNGPGIPKNIVGRALGMILAGTKFHRNVQQRGQQGIGAAGCTLFALTTTGKPIHVISSMDSGRAFSCDISIDTLHNKPIMGNFVELEEVKRGLTVKGEFGDVKYDTGEHSIFEYLRRTALSNPHVQITFIDPNNKEVIFPRSIDKIPEKPRTAKLHPLGLTISDLIETAHSSKNSKLSNFLMENFARFSQGKINELKGMLDVDFDKKPSGLTWEDAEKIIKAFKEIKWIAPESAHIMPIGEEQIKTALKNIMNPDFMYVVERKPKVFRGGFPFIVEAAIAFGGSAGKKSEEGYSGNVLRFANKVPLLFDTGNCAITDAVKEIQWKRYNIDMEKQPVSLFVNVSSVHIPYSGVGKESISKEAEIIEEIKLALMDAARGLQHFIYKKQKLSLFAGRYKTIMRYTNQLSKDLSQLSGKDKEIIQKMLEKIVEEHYPRNNKEDVVEDGAENNLEDKE